MAEVNYCIVCYTN